ncbi:hypothetical protein LCGC14_2438720 [marine sediment metagenome]|uniref:Transglycosylase SLT domain-containing protein n=1 Tax=marine sediment metagenome TaxID=412755 RepID=A0A0F9C727_9ZZZZ
MKIVVALIVSLLYALPNAHAGAVDDAIEFLHPKLPKKLRKLYSENIEKQATKHKMNPLIVVALIHGESRFTNLTKNRTNDYGLMQIHWQRVPWLKGKKRSDLMDPKFNIYAGFMELAYWRRWCNGKRGVKGHRWIGHYFNGNSVKSRRYEWAIMRMYRKLLHYAKTRKAKISYYREAQGAHKYRAHRALS